MSCSAHQALSSLFLTRFCQKMKVSGVRFRVSGNRINKS
jgi:hypothetical protein